MMLPILTVAALFGVVFTFTDMNVVYLLTRGGPYNSTHVLASLAYQEGVLGGDVGRGAAVAIFLVPLLVVMAVMMLRISRRAEVT
jgi:multiple sugar transport system permease protein